jgi:hypothetical protein
MSSQNPKLTITLTGRAPISITKTEWPILAIGKIFDGPKEDESKNIRCTTVREHEDGRVIVYSWWKSKETGIPWTRGGIITERPVSDEEIVQYIKDVTRNVLSEEHMDVAERCIANMPPEEV